MTDLGGPREGLCRTRSWLRYPDGEPLPDGRNDAQDHGVRSWADFLDCMTVAGATRPTYDLFDVPQPDGLVRRYRVVNEGLQP